MSTSDGEPAGGDAGGRPTAPRAHRAHRSITAIRPALPAIALALVATAVLYGVAVRALWLPGRHDLAIEMDAREHGTLRVTPHVGRGYSPSDAQDQPLRPGRRTYGASLPYDARAVKVQLLFPPASFTVGRILVDGHEIAPGSRTRIQETPTSIIVDKLPALIDPIPGWGHALCLLLAAGAVAGGLAAVRRRAIAPSFEPEALLTPAGLLAAGALAGGAVLALATCADVYSVLVRPIDNPPYWPISIVNPRVPGAAELLLACAVFLAFVPAARHVLRGGRSALPVLLLLAAATALASNLLAGAEHGLLVPLSEPSSYLADARDVRDPAGFLASFTERQLQLRTHSKTHPPGAILVYHALHRMLGDPMLIAIALGVVTSIATAALVYGVARRMLDRQQALFAALLAAALPAAQIYGVSSLDALVCALFTAVLYCTLHPDPRIRYGGGVLALFAATFVSFGALFLVPVLIGRELLARRSLRTAAVLVLGVAAAYAILAVATGFDWLESLRIASRRENPGGFRLLVNPGEYLFTRIECAAEMALFAGPVVIALWAAGLRAARAAARPVWQLAGLGALTLLAMFLSGSFKTGETARACLFFIPYLVLPVAALVGDGRALERARQLDVVCLAMAQSLAMQLCGDFFW